ncbi:centromere protein L [Stigmatopora nigra]
MFFFSGGLLPLGLANMLSSTKSVSGTPSSNKRRHRPSRPSTVAHSHLFLTRALSNRRLRTKRKIPGLLVGDPKQNGVRASSSGLAQDKAEPRELRSLVGTEWQLSYVTPLFRFCYTQLKSYARQLAAFVASETAAVAAADLAVNFSVVRGLAGTDWDAEAVFIQISAGGDKSAWSGWLACVNGYPDYLRSLPPDFVCLPLLAGRGLEPLGVAVRSWLSRTFDCSAAPLEMSHAVLQWLMALWVDAWDGRRRQQRQPSRELVAIWTLPAEPPLRVRMSVDSRDAGELWSSVRDPEALREGSPEGEIGWEEVSRFTKGLGGHFYRHFKVDLSAGNLARVATEAGAATREGRLKIHDMGSLNATLSLLTECALLKMPM